MCVTHILEEMRIIQLHLYLAKRSAKKSYLPCNTKMQHHIEHSLQSLNLLLSHIDDFKLEVD